MRSYEKRARGRVVERVVNVRQDTIRDRELDGWATARRTSGAVDGWYLAHDDLDDSTAGEQSLPGDHVDVAEVLAAADREHKRRTRRSAPETPPATEPTAQAETE